MIIALALFMSNPCLKCGDLRFIVPSGWKIHHIEMQGQGFTGGFLVGKQRVLVSCRPSMPKTVLGMSVTEYLDSGRWLFKPISIQDQLGNKASNLEEEGLCNGTNWWYIVDNFDEGRWKDADFLAYVFCNGELRAIPIKIPELIRNYRHIFIGFGPNKHRVMIPKFNQIDKGTIWVDFNDPINSVTLSLWVEQASEGQLSQMIEAFGAVFDKNGLAVKNVRQALFLTTKN